MVLACDGSACSGIEIGCPAALRAVFADPVNGATFAFSGVGVPGVEPCCLACPTPVVNGNTFGCTGVVTGWLAVCLAAATGPMNGVRFGLSGVGGPGSAPWA